MGKIVIEKLVDDMTGREVIATEATTVYLTYRIVPPVTEETEDEPPAPEVGTFELFYSVESTEQFRATMKTVTKHAEPVDPVTTEAGTVKTRKRANPANTVIRAWWRSLTPAQRMSAGNLPAPPPNDRGQVPAAVQEAWASLTDDDKAKFAT